MNIRGDTSRSSRRTAPPGRTASEPLLATAAWLSRFHNRPWSEIAALSRLPTEYDPNDRSHLSAALAATRLKSRLVSRSLKQIDPAVLPCVLFDHSGAPILLLNIDADQGNLRVVEPGRGDVETEIALNQLAKRVHRDVLLVTVEDELAKTHPAFRNGGTNHHWFWGPMRENWGEWFQVLVAALCINTLGLALPIFVMNVYDRVIPNLAFVTLWTLALGVAIAVLLDWILRTVRASIMERIGRRLDTGISASLFRQMMNLRPADLPGGSAGIATHFRDFEAVRDFFGSASLLSLIDLAFIGLFFAVLYMIVGPLAFVPMAAIPAILILAVIAQFPLARSARQTQSAARRKHAVLTETLSGLETVKTLNAEPTLQREWNRASAAASRIGGRGRFWSNFTANGTQTVQQFVSICIIVWGVFLISEGSITVGALIAANILASRALAPLGTIAQTIFRAQFAWRSMKVLSAFMAQDTDHPRKIRSALRVAEGRLELKDITFRYATAELPAVRDFSASFAPGEKVALIGRVGSGKSTLGKLICGLLSHQDGTILVDGHSAGQYDPAELRAGIGYLPQNAELFTGTLGENLQMGHGNPSTEEIHRALYLAGIDDFVSGLPNGLGHFIGERGGHLSGGQQQALALARLLLRQPRVLFLDEPTNAMDREMEAKVARRLNELSLDGTTLILCTHRPALADIADRMIVMDRGRKILDGPRDAVISQLQAAQAKASDKGG